jgi:hypothetical protein
MHLHCSTVHQLLHFPSQGLDNRSDQELSELCSWCWTLSRRKPLPNKLSHLERAAHRPDNLPLQPLSTQFQQGTGDNNNNRENNYEHPNGNSRTLRHSKAQAVTGCVGLLRKATQDDFTVSGFRDVRVCRGQTQRQNSFRWRTSQRTPAEDG